jgi:O-antigen/teichoic acid export membrane protein
MSTGLNTTPSADTAASSMVLEVPRTEAHPLAPVERRLALFRQLLSPETALHHGAFSLADQAVVSATNFLTGVILARATSKEELGLYMLGFTLILLMLDLQTSLVATPYMVYSPRLKGKAHALYTGSTLIHQLTFCLIAMLGVACSAVAVTHGIGPRGLGPVLWALVLVITLIMLREHARRVSFARLRLKTAFLFDMFIAIGQISGLVILARFHLLSASRAYWVIGAVCGIGVAGWLWFDRGFYDPRMSESLADFKKNWMLGKWVFASGLVWAVSMNLYPWFLAAFHGTASAGVWGACLGVVSVGNPALLGIQNLVGPKIAHSYVAAGSKALRRLVLRITVAICLPVSVLCLALIVWGGRLVTLLYGRQYAGDNLVVAILALIILVAVPSFSFSRALFAIERADLDFQVSLAALLVMVTTGFWLVRAFGVLGAACGLLATNFIVAAVRAVAFLRLSSRVSDETDR